MTIIHENNNPNNNPISKNYLVNFVLTLRVQGVELEAHVWLKIERIH